MDALVCRDTQIFGCTGALCYNNALNLSLKVQSSYIRMCASHCGDYIVQVSSTVADVFCFVRATGVWKDGGGGRNMRSFLLDKEFVILKWLFSTTTTVSD